MEYRSSLIGFHNPYKHRGLTPEQFLRLYVDRLKSMSKKKDGWKRVKLAEWIEAHWTDQIKFVSRLFPQTLGVKAPPKKGAVFSAELALKRNKFKLSLPKYRQKTIKNWEIDKDLRLLGEI